MTKPEIKEVENNTLAVIDSLYRLGVSLHDFQSLPIVHQRVNQYISNLAMLADKAGQVEQEAIPGALIHTISTSNPELYTKELVQTLIDKNQKTAGKISTLEMFSADLEKQVAVNYPEIAGILMEIQ